MRTNSICAGTAIVNDAAPSEGVDMPTFWALLIILASIVTPAHGSARAESAARIDDFFGVYEGTAVSRNEEGITTRDLGVEIKPTNDGFNLKWTTVIPKSSGRIKRSEYSIDFERTKRRNIYESAMRTDMFGNRIPLNPLDGDPYVWATLNGQTLTVHALIITDDGTYEMQTYDRTLEENGIHLEFQRVRSGLNMRYITGTLKRVR